MNFEKTKTMVFGEKEPTGKLLIDGRHLENVEQFTYLGSNTTYDLDNMREVRTRPAKATAALKAMEKVWKSRSIEIETKKRMLQTCVFSILLYGCEAWVVTKELEQRIMAFERKCYRKIRKIGWTQKVKNIDLYGRIQLKEYIMQKLIGRQLGLFGHICRMQSNMNIKELMFGRMEGTNKRGRPHREWLDDIIKWGGMPLQKLSQMASDRGSWRKLTKLASDTYGR